MRELREKPALDITRKTEIYPKPTPILLYYGQSPDHTRDAWQCEACGRLVVISRKKPEDTPKGPCPHCGVEFWGVQSAMHAHLRGFPYMCQICDKEREKWTRRE